MQENFKTEKKGFSKVDFLGNVFLVMACLAVIFLLFSVFLPKLSYNVVVIKTGSMEPTIKVGSVILTKKVNEYNVDDVITFVNSNQDLITHRIIKVSENKGEIQFETKGDANNDSDRALVEPQNVLGKEFFKVPFLGYVIMWTRSPIGIIILFGIPTIWLIYGEIMKIKREFKRKKEQDSRFYF